MQHAHDRKDLGCRGNLTCRHWLKKAIFRKEGEYWTIAHGEGALVRLMPVNSERRTDRLDLESRQLRKRSEQIAQRDRSATRITTGFVFLPFFSAIGIALVMRAPDFSARFLTLAAILRKLVGGQYRRFQMACAEPTDAFNLLGTRQTTINFSSIEWYASRVACASFALAPITPPPPLGLIKSQNHAPSLLQIT